MEGRVCRVVGHDPPAFLVLPLLRWVGATRRDRRLRSALNAVVIASSALLLGTTISLARSLQGNWFLLAVSAALLVTLTATRQSALRVMAAAGLASLVFAAWRF
jgi:chromate transport protein ChrA